MERAMPFFCSVLIGVWLSDEVSQVTGGWILPLLVGIAVFFGCNWAAYSPIRGVPPWLQGLLFGLATWAAAVRLAVLNAHSDADVGGMAFFGFLFCLTSWAMVTRIKKELNRQEQERGGRPR